MCRIGSGCSVFPNGWESISCSIAVFWQNWVAAHGRYWIYIWLKLYPMTMPKPVLRSLCRVLASGSESDFQNFNSHLHVICTDGCFYGKGSFKTCPTTPNPKDLEDLFRYEIFKMLKSEGKINDLVIENMMNWPPARRAIEPTPRRAPQRIQRVLW